MRAQYVDIATLVAEYTLPLAHWRVLVPRVEYTIRVPSDGCLECSKRQQCALRDVFRFHEAVHGDATTATLEEHGPLQRYSRITHQRPGLSYGLHLGVYLLGWPMLAAGDRKLALGLSGAEYPCARLACRS